MPRADDGTSQQLAAPLVTVIAGRGQVAAPGGKALWSQSIFDDLDIGCKYTLCCCCCGAPEAAARVANYLHRMPGGAPIMCGFDTTTFGCWCCCPIIFIRGARVAIRSEQSLTGGVLEDACVGDNCAGCALRQLEMQVVAVEKRGLPHGDYAGAWAGTADIKPSAPHSSSAVEQMER